jgi:acetyl esterase/lipase
MMNRFFLAFLLGSMCLAAQSPKTILLWPNGAPGAKGDADIDKPDLSLYIASQNKVPTGIIVCPGGGYVHLAMSYEGTDVAKWLNTMGISAFVLKYRLGPKYHHPAELDDAQRAIRYVRAHAAEFGIDPHHIGIWGFSAGGHLASTAGTHFDNGTPNSADPIDRESSRPDFMILAYPVITFEEPYAHRGSRDALLGPNPDPALVELLSNEEHVTKDTPPTFLFHTSDDPVVPVQNSINFYLALRRAGVPAEMHIYEHGRHGVGLAQDIPELSTWPTLLANWLKVRGLR